MDRVVLCEKEHLNNTAYVVCTLFSIQLFITSRVKGEYTPYLELGAGNLVSGIFLSDVMSLFPPPLISLMRAAAGVCPSLADDVMTCESLRRLSLSDSLLPLLRWFDAPPLTLPSFLMSRRDCCKSSLTSCSPINVSSKRLDFWPPRLWSGTFHRQAEDRASSLVG